MPEIAHIFGTEIVKEIVPEIVAFNEIVSEIAVMTFQTIRNIKEILAEIVPCHAKGHVNGMYHFPEHHQLK